MNSEQKQIIDEAYHNNAGFGSRMHTYKVAHAKDSNINMKMVAQWMDANVEHKKQLPGYNSFVAHKAKEEYQVDLMFLKDKVVPDRGGKMKMLPHSDKPLMIMTDIFSKVVGVVPIESKTANSILDGIEKLFSRGWMDGKPEILYSDQEPGLRTEKVINYLDTVGTELIMTRGHAPFVERQIRTIKDMILKRVEHSKDWAIWRNEHFLWEICSIRNYDRKSSATHMIPRTADQPENRDKVYNRLETIRVKKRKYPPVAVGNYVKYYTKKKEFAKEFESLWSKTAYKVKSIEDWHGQKYYTLEGLPDTFMRHEILKVPPPAGAEDSGSD